MINRCYSHSNDTRSRRASTMPRDQHEERLAMRYRQTLCLLVGLFTLVACAQTIPVRHVQESGFLGADAAKLHQGGKGEPALFYRQPNVNWASYTRLMLDPVTFWRPPDAHDQGMSHADAQTLANYFYNLIYQTFAQELDMVQTPQPHTLRAKVAITKAEPSHVVLDVVSTVVPQLHAVSALDRLVTGKPAFVGAVRIEVKVTDATTGELLYASVAERVGGKSLDAEHFKAWGDVEQALQFWTNHAAYRLCELQHRSTCVEPKS